ncbi:MAG: putative ABC transporter permease [Ruminococcus sp.]|nr:putative ABC transporter permease [Ruminococcus sp.]
MSFILILAFLFAIGSLIGWVLELFFRRFFDKANKERKWINPGFLNGPYLPIYGISLIMLYLLAQLEQYVHIDNDVIRKLILFFIMAACITIFEFFTGMIFIVKLKIELWDYTEQPGNIKGVICPLFSFFWMVLSAIYYFLIDPYIQEALLWLSQNLAFSFFIGAFFGVFAVDLTVTIRDMIKIYIFANENEIIVRLEELKYEISEFKAQRKEKYGFFMQLRSSDTIQHHLERYKSIQEGFDKYKDKLKEITEKR